MYRSTASSTVPLMLRCSCSASSRTSSNSSGVNRIDTYFTLRSLGTGGVYSFGARCVASVTHNGHEMCYTRSMNTKRTERKAEKYLVVTAADGTEYECRLSDLGELLRVLPGFRGWRRVG